MWVDVPMITSAGRMRTSGGAAGGSGVPQPTAAEASWGSAHTGAAVAYRSPGRSNVERRGWW